MNEPMQPFVVTGTKRNGKAWERVINASAPEGARIEAERRGMTVGSVVTLAEHEAAEEASRQELDRQAQFERERQRSMRDSAAVEALEQRRAEAQNRRRHHLTPSKPALWVQIAVGVFVAMMAHSIIWWLVAQAEISEAKQQAADFARQIDAINPRR